MIGHGHLRDPGTQLCGMNARRLICAVRGHKWRRFRREGEDTRQCLRCGYLVRSAADPPNMMGTGTSSW